MSWDAMMPWELQEELQRAVAACNVPAVRELLERLPSNHLEHQDTQGRTPLYNACVANSLELVEALLRKDANVDCANRYGETPLSHAAAEGKLQLVDMLCRAGADPRTPGATGATPYTRAAAAGHRAVAACIRRCETHWKVRHLMEMETDRRPAVERQEGVKRAALEKKFNAAMLQTLRLIKARRLQQFAADCAGSDSEESECADEQADTKEEVMPPPPTPAPAPTAPQRTCEEVPAERQDSGAAAAVAHVPSASAKPACPAVPAGTVVVSDTNVGCAYDSDRFPSGSIASIATDHTRHGHAPTKAARQTTGSVACSEESLPPSFASSEVPKTAEGSVAESVASVATAVSQPPSQVLQQDDAVPPAAPATGTQNHEMLQAFVDTYNILCNLGNKRSGAAGLPLHAHGAQAHDPTAHALLARGVRTPSTSAHVRSVTTPSVASIRTPLMSAAPSPQWPVMPRALTPQEAYKKLCSAAHCGDVASCAQLAKLTPVDRDDCEGHTPLVWAVVGGQLDVVKWLLQHGARMDKRDGCGYTPLVHAVQHRHLEIVRHIATLNPALLSVVDNEGHNLVHWAAFTGSMSILSLLVETCRLDVSCIDRDGKTALHWAAHQNRVDATQYLMTRMPPSLQMLKDRSGATAAEQARAMGHGGIVQLLNSSPGAVLHRMM